jgi:ketosteroid isomerase-like protein
VTAGQRLALGDRQGLLAVVAEGHAELAASLQRASEGIETTYPTPPEFVAQGDRVLIVGVATGKIKATNKPFKDNWVFDITVRNGKLAKIREYIDTQALARASCRRVRAGVAPAICGDPAGV